MTVTASQAMDMGASWPARRHPRLKSKLPSLLPLLALLLGLAFVQWMHMDDQIRDAAEVDSALLADDLPPEAYSDPGFAEYLEKPFLEDEVACAGAAWRHRGNSCRRFVLLDPR